MKRLQHKLFYTIGIIVISIGLQAQSLDQAKKLYNEGKYAEAKPAFEKLVKTSPSNSSYNHWYGVCCFETGDLDNAEKYLSVAVKRKVQEAYRYMAELYFLKYKFNEAVEMYDEYIALLTKKKQDTQAWEEKKKLAETAARMLSKTENIQIIDSMVVDKNDFLSVYHMSNESGSLQPFAEFFQNNQPVNSVVYMNEKGDKIYYSHETEDAHYCLFTQSKLMDKWGDEKQLPMNVNSNNNDNYPFVLTDGVTMYYASEGNGSLGGYDIFVTRYNTGSDTYLAPEQLGMPFNSPYNDYMYVLDESKGLGWFATDRFQPEGKVAIYLFIPNETRLNVETDDDEVKRSRAMISSISDSWTPGADYSELVKLAKTKDTSGQEIKKDFNFVITDNIVYFTIDDIQSPEARALYEKVINLRKQLQELNTKLDEQRTAYSADKAGQAQLKPSILQLEQQVENLLLQPQELEKQARNAEITFLRNKK